MSSRLDRMIARARAPLSALRPVMPSTFSSEGPSPLDSASESFAAIEPHGFINKHSLDAHNDDYATRAIEMPLASGARQALSGNLSPGDQVIGLAPRASFEKSDQPISQPAQPPSTPLFPPEQSVNLGLSERTLPSDSHRTPDANSPSISAAKEDKFPNPLSQAKTETATLTASLGKAGAPSPHMPIPESQESPIEINVSIGSIEFRSARQAEPMKRPDPHPHLTLDSYLQRGSREGR